MNGIEIRNVCLCGGGSLSHVVAGWLAREGYGVSVFTRSPERWDRNLTIHTPEGGFTVTLKAVSADPAEVIADADVVLLTVPGYGNRDILTAIKPWLKKGCFVGGVFCSSGFFFEAMEMLPETVKLWGFQRVPFISRVDEYGHSAYLLGYRPEFRIAVEHAVEEDKEAFRLWVEKAFGSKTVLLNNYLEASITNSNPILHTARLYTMFAGENEGRTWDHNILFYEEWTVEAAELMMKMDAELFRILKELPVSPDYLVPLVEYYEGHDAVSVKDKLSSISGLKGITSPMKQTAGGWVPNFGDRYFLEDFGFSLRYIYLLARKHGIATPNIDKVYLWGLDKIKSR